MSRPFFSPSARRDLQEILEFIALDKPGAALRHVERLESACWDLAKNPELRATRNDILPQLRVWSVGNYVIFYRRSDDGIEIIRVVHGARNFNELFR
jgi:toxin ParE1/3/4